MNSEIDEILRAYEIGQDTWSDAMSRLLYLAPRYRFEDIIGSLPEPWGTDFVQWARESYDNDTPLEDFIVIGAPASAQDLAPVRLFREWVRQQPK